MTRDCKVFSSRERFPGARPISLPVETTAFFAAPDGRMIQDAGERTPRLVGPMAEARPADRGSACAGHDTSE
jgi:hypothetical protein